MIPIILIVAVAVAVVVVLLLRRKAATPETFDAMLLRTEGVTVDQITAHADGAAPDAQKVYAAWVRGRNRVIALYPAAATVKMSDMFFFRPKLYWFAEKPYPLINLMPDGQPPNYVRGVTSPDGPVLIQYSYENVVEHEACHALVRSLDGAKQRAPEAIAGSAPGQQAPYFFQITCHGTPDDPLGEPGNIDSCVLPYDGPPAPVL